MSLLNRAFTQLNTASIKACQWNNRTTVPFMKKNAGLLINKVLILNIFLNR
jgi:hypothetical protein